ncbi:MAG: molybdopterin molybdotransferase MoeA [Gemmatimonadetes bacterium]|nr:molybdopterin molybdotransferase MoeA [Gemmatimonadota bacterium]
MTRFESRDPDWLAPGDALARIMAATPRLASEEVALEAAFGRVLGEDVTAGATLPPWDNSAMDGYAVRGADIDGASEHAPRVLRVVGEVWAGDAADTPEVGPGEAVRIMTGGPIPGGADSVVRVEHTDAEAGAAGRVAVKDDRDRGRNVRPAGEDTRTGDVVLAAGAAIGAGQVAALASAGRATVRVAIRPRVAVLCSGDELRGADAFEDVVAGRGIPDSNGPMLAAALAGCGAQAVALGVAPDREDAVRAHLERAVAADALVTVGGASMGEAYLFKRVLDAMGFQLDFWRVRLRPGTPFGFGHLPRDSGPPLPVFSLPGNPASAFVTFQLLVRPFLMRAAGRSDVHLPSVQAVAGEPLSGGGRHARAWRVRLAHRSGERIAWLAGPQSSGLVRSLALADALVVVPQGREVAEGGGVRALLLDRGPAGASTPPFPHDPPS